MVRLIIFGGTSEGRELAEWAAENGFSVILSVATDYGESVCTPDEHLTVRKGRMDCEGMSTFFENERPQLVIDATHPHATAVSGNIKKAAASLNLPLIRVVRPEAVPCQNEAYTRWEKDSVFYVSDASEARRYLETDEEPILLTTGSKELKEFSSLSHFAERVYARVLPQSGIISDCENTGLKGKHIIAMQGPFSKELNLALINSVGAKWLVTKESGESGGYTAKMEAAALSGIRVIVIRRPAQEKGLSLDETKEELLKLRTSSSECVSGTLADDTLCPADIALIGIGMGGGSQLTLEALETLKASSVIFGAKRMLGDIQAYVGDIPLVPLYKRDDILSYLEEHPGSEKVCVVFSGDTGFYSGCAGFVEDAENEEEDDGKILRLRCADDVMPAAKVRILPGISSFSCLCARFGLREEEFTPASAHGKDADAVNLLKDHGKVFLLLDPKTTIGVVCRALVKEGLGGTKVYAGIRLGYEDEELLFGKAEDLTGRDGDELAVMALESEGSQDAR